ncbi:ATP-binding protein [Streptomyces rugosispiralis]|uniref:ATP-binding protein n=1 Tax=Streptomyces rugosispiralis TaxID=2967341 RepID=A0ABT1UWR4_9ACTN|nr:ATP-binding protein [Streptomyces rugosispiralis]MCQ8189487.1 ATP-binding protein [Streptomyces rugosispiralis]
MTPFPPPLLFTEPWEYELRFPRDPRGPGIVRATLRAVLTAHGLRELVERAALLTSELTTNSVRYSDNWASVRLLWLHPVLRISVTDTNPELPEPLKPSAESASTELENGRGLFILDVLADRWGGCAIGEEPFGFGGKTLWFELSWGGPPPAPIPALAA